MRFGDRNDELRGRLRFPESSSGQALTAMTNSEGDCGACRTGDVAQSDEGACRTGDVAQSGEVRGVRAMWCKAVRCVWCVWDDVKRAARLVNYG